MKKLWLSVFLVHAATHMHFAKANSITETISSTASLIFSAKVLIPVTLGTALYLSLSGYRELSRSHDRLKNQNKIYKKALDFHDIKFQSADSGYSIEILNNDQPIGGKYKTLFEKSEQENRELKTQLSAMETKNSILSGVLHAIQTTNADAFMKLLIQQKK